MNVQSAKLARAACDQYSTPDKPRFVAGALGPTPKTASISPDVNDPAARNVNFDQLVSAYLEQTRALVEGGADILMVETIFDTLNCKAALFAIDTFFEEVGYTLPLMISGTVTDASGRILSGQTVTAFWNSVRHAKPLTIGLNIRSLCSKRREISFGNIGVFVRSIGSRWLRTSFFYRHWWNYLGWILSSAKGFSSLSLP